MRGLVFADINALPINKAQSAIASNITHILSVYFPAIGIRLCSCLQLEIANGAPPNRSWSASKTCSEVWSLRVSALFLVKVRPGGHQRSSGET